MIRKAKASTLQALPVGTSTARLRRQAIPLKLPAVPNSKGQPTVYVSSTFLDLEGHRAALKSALEKARYDVECMETYTAFDERPLDRCLADVAATDVYVLLIAHRYGYRPAENNPQRRSITHLEYEEASRHQKPRLVFTVDRKELWLPDWIDSGADGADLAAFRAEVEQKLASPAVV